MPLKRSLLAALLTPLVVMAMHASPSATAVVPSADDLKPRALDHQGAGASKALAEARSVLAGRSGSSAPDRDATMVLRDLVLARDALSGEERREADRILARPTDGAGSDPDAYQAGVAVRRDCNSVCVHWVESTADGVNTTDSDGNDRPDYVDAVLQTMTHVHSTYLAAGYRAPKADGTLGGDARPDIYLANIGDDDLYGYCTTDESVPSTGPFDAWAYCVLDNDYSAAEFPTNTPLENMQVTAAHEYFHAVQFGYDLLEDAWFMEATATWVEDELYDDVDDNLNYLPSGPLGRPSWSLDTFQNGGGYQYGAWIFFRFLTERFPAEVGGLPSLVRDMWAKADGSAGAPDQYSMQAVASVLKQRGGSLSNLFTAFAAGNRRPASTYSEGAVNAYPAAPFGRFVAKKPWFTTKLDHLSSATGAFAPKRGFSKLKVVLDMAPKRTGSTAIGTVVLKNGRTRSTRFSLNRKGNGAQVFAFAPASVKAVEVTLVNASTKFQCWSGMSFSCQGRPVFDNMTAKLRGVLIR